MSDNYKEKTYFITGGGTGGHIYPAIAVINTLLEKGVNSDKIYYLGNKNNMEYEIAKKNNLNFLDYKAKGMPRKISIDFLFWFFELFLATLKALSYVIKYKPNIIFATGGYVCAPILFCAIFLKIPYVLHDCDITPGLVTKLFSPFARSISLAFQTAEKSVKSKHIYVNGNPIRKEFQTISKMQARKELSLNDNFTIAIMGGSLGAQKINDSSFRLLKEYANKKDVNIIWQTGKKNFDDVIKKILKEFDELPDNLILQPYFDKMYLVLLSADIVISRAGSLSLSEICACSLPSVLIPYPHASANHQKKNAQELVNRKIAVMIEDKFCDNDKLFDTISNLINNREFLSELSFNAKKYAKTNATEQIFNQLKIAMGE